MPGFARRTGEALSADARKRIASMKHYPTLDMWRNPVTRGFARKLVNEDWRKALGELDFEYRLSEMDIAGVRVVAYETAQSKSGSPVLIFVHGGGFVAGGPDVNAASILPTCLLSGCDGVGLDYSLLPDAAFPVQINELDAVYRALLSDHPEKTYILAAEATGAAIALSALMNWRDAQLPMPAGAILMSPCVDGEGASDTQITLDKRDPLIRSMNGAYVRSLFKFYAPGAALNDPQVSPIYGAFRGLPPILVQAGSREVFLGDGARLAQRARRAGVDAHLQVFDGMYHRFHAHWSVAEARAAHQDIADFIARL